MTQLELQKETQVDPYILFEYSIRSPHTKESYFRKLRRFFDAISLEGITFESRCNLFAERGKQDPNWAFNSILKFVLQEKERDIFLNGSEENLSKNKLLKPPIALKFLRGSNRTRYKIYTFLIFPCKYCKLF